MGDVGDILPLMAAVQDVLLLIKSQFGLGLGITKRKGGNIF